MATGIPYCLSREAVVDRFNTYAVVLFSFVFLGWQSTHPPGARSALLETLCPPEEDSPIVMQSLIEEAEATGMPPSTLNRLLIKGYRPSTGCCAPSSRPRRVGCLPNCYSANWTRGSASARLWNVLPKSLKPKSLI